MGGSSARPGRDDDDHDDRDAQQADGEPEHPATARRRTEPTQSHSQVEPRGGWSQARPSPEIRAGAVMSPVPLPCPGSAGGGVRPAPARARSTPRPTPRSQTGHWRHPRGGRPSSALSPATIRSRRSAMVAGSTPVIWAIAVSSRPRCVHRLSSARSAAGSVADASISLRVASFTRSEGSGDQIDVALRNSLNCATPSGLSMEALQVRTQTTVRRSLASLALALVAVVILPAQALGKALVRFIHAVPGAGTATIKVNTGQGNQNLGSIGFAQVSPWRSIRSGSFRWSLTGGGKVLASGTSTVGDGVYDIVVLDKPSGIGVQLGVYKAQGGRAGTSLVRVIHAAPELGTPMFHVGSHVADRMLAYQGATPYVSVAPGVDSVRAMKPSLMKPGDPTLVNVHGVHFAPGVAYSAIVVGSRGQMVRLVTVVDRGAPLTRPATTGGCRQPGRPRRGGSVVVKPATRCGALPAAASRRRQQHRDRSQAGRDLGSQRAQDRDQRPEPDLLRPAADRLIHGARRTLARGTQPSSSAYRARTDQICVRPPEAAARGSARPPAVRTSGSP